MGVLDRIREPLKYGWLADQEAAEDLDRERKNLKPLKRKLPSACRGMAGYCEGRSSIGSPRVPLTS